jgi:spermidine synthase|tara:strand:- start:6245 stop:6808 length:564 start_codon:yes stop_codon:yes gene_type:complete
MFNYESSIGETDKFRKPHNYQIIFPNFFLTKPKNILEIGTSSCGFAKFLKDNKIGEWIVGADITKGLVSHHIPSNLTWEHLFDDFFEGDAMSQEFRDWIAKKEYKFDLIFEDASHTLEMQKHMISTCDTLLSENGVYITEDIASYMNAKSIIRSVPTALRQYAYIADLTDSIGDPYDMVVVVDKRRL